MRKLLLGVAASTLLITGALAADPSVVVPATFDTATFDWDGFYMGVGVTGLAVSTGATAGFGDLIFGVNATSGNMLFGLEGWVGAYSSSIPSTGWGVGAEARAGYLVSPEALLYLSGGGVALDTGGSAGTVGFGAEFAVTNDITFDLEYKYWMATFVTGHSLGASMNWHF